MAAVFLRFQNQGLAGFRDVRFNRFRSEFGPPGSIPQLEAIRLAVAGGDQVAALDHGAPVGTEVKPAVAGLKQDRLTAAIS